MVPRPFTGSNARSMDMQFTQVAYGGCWKCPQDWQRCRASTPCLAASQKGLVHSFGTGIGLVTLLQSLIVMVCCLPFSWGASLSRLEFSHALPARGLVVQRTCSLLVMSAPSRCDRTMHEAFTLQRS